MNKIELLENIQDINISLMNSFSSMEYKPSSAFLLKEREKLEIQMQQLLNALESAFIRLWIP